MAETTKVSDHWDDRYRTVGPTDVSWYESEPRLSLAMLELGGLARDRSVIDVGGGASSLSARLVARGHRDVTVVDVSAEALRITRSSIADSEAVTFIEADITDSRHYSEEQARTRLEAFFEALEG